MVYFIYKSGCGLSDEIRQSNKKGELNAIQSKNRRGYRG
jgi:hypothetical protein